MPGQFSGLGITLLYPDNWKMDQEDDDSVSLESPGGAFLTITKLDSDVSPESAIEKARMAMEEEYEAIETETCSRQLSGVSLNGITQRFVFLDLIIAAHWLSLEHQQTTILAQIQGEDREVDELLPVFDAILTSMCQSLTEAQTP